MNLSGEEWSKRLQIVNTQKEMNKKYDLETSYKHEVLYQRYLLGKVDHEEFKEEVMTLNTD